MSDFYTKDHTLELRYMYCCGFYPYTKCPDWVMIVNKASYLPAGRGVKIAFCFNNDPTHSVLKNRKGLK